MGAGVGVAGRVGEGVGLAADVPPHDVSSKTRTANAERLTALSVARSTRIGKGLASTGRPAVQGKGAARWPF